MSGDVRLVCCWRVSLDYRVMNHYIVEHTNPYITGSNSGGVKNKNGGVLWC